MNRLREENVNLKEIFEELSQRKQQEQLMISPCVVKEDLEVVNFLKMNAESKERETHQKLHEIAQQKEAAANVVEKLMIENDVLRKECENLKLTLTSLKASRVSTGSADVVDE